MKSLFRSYSFTGDQEAMTSRIVIAESAIDAMSHAQLFPQENTIYASTAGTNLTAEQQEHLRALFAEHSTATLVLAMDNDEFNKRGELQAFDDRPGEKMAKLVASLAPLGMHFERHTPTLKDWNADLLAMRAP
jgi:hypothetical protein